jgi:hypothetical protein
MSALALSYPPSETVVEVNYQVSAIGQNSSNVVSVIFIAEAVPTSFLEALEDFKAGRVFDMEQALNEPPPADV